MIDSELPIDTLDMSDLLMQFKVMKALGYKSLFDKDFRREIRNPYRRLLYYRLVLTDSLMDKRFMIDALKTVSDRVGFFTDPQLFNKVRDAEQAEEMKDPDIADDVTAVHEAKYKKAQANYVPPDEETMANYNKF